MSNFLDSYIIVRVMTVAKFYFSCVKFNVDFSLVSIWMAGLRPLAGGTSMSPLE